ncbi:50S ribosomal protein L16 [Thermorudis peleae]|uniref:50S ribosomal protein L16 n=1 Tax=Thermorudis peleae TaxID=1382356 RepID=UPI00056F9AAF|nr:50S ribosomal protein L16 [Thermorudis peleae]MBX6754018.1 50S ribosomal protein L16 [Thermorudis peleae]
MLMPRRVKYRKQHRYRTRGIALRGNTVAFGEWGIQALEPAYVTAQQIEAARRAITNAVRRGGKIWIRIFPDKPVTKKPAETRMGSGKGSPEYWMDVVKPGRILFELAGVREDLAIEALTRAIHKLPCKCRIVKRETAAETTVATGD